MPTGFTTVSATNLCDATGTLVANATISFKPVDNKGNAISFRAVDTAEGQSSFHPVTATVTNGAFEAPGLTLGSSLDPPACAIDNCSAIEVVGASLGRWCCGVF